MTKTHPKQNYLLIGAGGTGSILFPLLTRFLDTLEKTERRPYSLVVIDGKAVAASKLDRQIFFNKFVAANKAEALIAQYESDPKVIIAVPRYLGANDMDAIVENDIILIAADNWPIRAHIEARALQLRDVTIINGGNEHHDGSLQIWMRRKGKNITPPLSQGHPEVHSGGEDMATLSCAQIAELPGGGQTIIANSMSATAMLNAIRHVHEWKQNAPTWNEVYFDLNTYAMRSTAR